MSSVMQKALLPGLRSMGIPMHEAIPIIADLTEFARKSLKPNFGGIGIFKRFDGVGKATGDISGCLVRGSPKKTRSHGFREPNDRPFEAGEVVIPFLESFDL